MIGDDITINGDLNFEAMQTNSTQHQAFMSLGNEKLFDLFRRGRIINNET